jgi:hypothetical protein
MIYNNERFNHFHLGKDVGSLFAQTNPRLHLNSNIPTILNIPSTPAKQVKSKEVDELLP